MANLVVSGDTSGSVTLSAPAIAGSPVVTLPNTTGTLALTSELPITANTQTFNANGTWTKPAGAYTTVQVIAWGAGGGGGRGGDTASVATGGGAGGYGVWNFPISYFPNSTTVTVGTGGSGGSTGTQDGSAGGNTSVVSGIFNILITGGEGGKALASPANQTSAKGSQPSNTWNPVDEAGGDSAYWDGSVLQPAESRYFSGGGGGAVNVTTFTAGGTSVYGGNGGAGGNDATNGTNGSTPGGGGGGTETGIGGTGGNGRVIVVTF